LIGRRLTFIDPLCRVCHLAIEFDSGNKRTFGQARVLTNKLKRIANECPLT
jgi:hypothetical protein